MKMRKLTENIIGLCLILLTAFCSSEPSCGQSGTCQRGLVTDGLLTCISEFPWTAILIDTSTILRPNEVDIFCGASILNSKFLLSAAHCFKYNQAEIDRKIDTTRVYIGIDNRNEVLNRLATYHFIENVNIHPDWLKNSDIFVRGNDIAIIKLESPIKLSRTVAPICLPEIDQQHLIEVDRAVKLAGFGLTDPYSWNGPRYLRKGEFKMIDCGEQNNICAAEREDGQVIRKTCSGDSGSGLVGNDNGSFFLVGVVSWGTRCGKDNNVTRYVNVLDHLQWINNIIGECYTVTGSKCILPFTFNKISHNKCISFHPSSPERTFPASCPTTVDIRGEGANFEYCGRKCPGFKKPIQGIWETWSSWSQCLANCERTRERTCREPKFGGFRCKGDRDREIEIEPCNTDDCEESTIDEINTGEEKSVSTTTTITSTTKSPLNEYEREQIWSIVNNGISTSTQKLEVTNPFFISKPGNYRTQLGGRVTFVCEVGNVGSKAVIWKKDNHIITVGELVIRKDKRFSLDKYNLSLKGAALSDAGEYVCEVETHNSKLLKQISQLQVLMPTTVQPHPQNGNRGTSKSASSVCRTEETKNTQLKSNALCQFPFRHKNVTYVGCTSDEEHVSKPWCSTKVDQEGNHVAKQGEYGHCRENCPMFIPGIVDEGVKKCEEGRICRRRVDCPEINKRVLKLQGKRKNGVNVTEELKQLKSLVCNRHPKAFCCPT